MRIYVEFGTIEQIFECFGFLINGGSVASVSYALETLPFMVGETNLHGMEFRSSTISAGGLSEAYGSALLDLFLWELCFSLVSPLWESCYSLASCRLFRFLFFFLLLSFLLRLLFHLFFLSHSPLFPFLPHKLFPSIFLLLLFSTSFLSFSFFSFSLSPFPFLFVFCLFFLEGISCIVCFRDVIDGTIDCN